MITTKYAVVYQPSKIYKAVQYIIPYTCQEEDMSVETFRKCFNTIMNNKIPYNIVICDTKEFAMEKKEYLNKKYT